MYSIPETWWDNDAGAKDLELGSCKVPNSQDRLSAAYFPKSWLPRPPSLSYCCFLCSRQGSGCKHMEGILWCFRVQHGRGHPHPELAAMAHITSIMRDAGNPSFTPNPRTKHIQHGGCTPLRVASPLWVGAAGPREREQPGLLLHSHPGHKVSFLELAAGGLLVLSYKAGPVMVCTVQQASPSPRDPSLQSKLKTLTYWERDHRRKEKCSTL